jgi:hypothetical protein
MMLGPAYDKLAIVSWLLARSLLLVGAAACTYNWTEGPRDSGSADVSASDSASADAGEDVGAPGDASATCNFLAGEVGLDRSKIIHCTSQCMQSVSDACGCTVPVEDAQSQPAKDYVSAVAQYKMAGCVPDCSSGCGSVAHECFNGLCI